MEKEPVEKFDLEAAFKALDEIEIPETKGIKANRVDLKERFTKKSAHEALVEDYYDVTSNEDLEEAQEEREGEVAQAKLARIEKIVDLDAETADDLLPSYVGKVIMQCPQCMTLFYKNPEDIEHSEENPDVVNINEICQHCGNASGYTLIGKVDSVNDDEMSNYVEGEGELPVEENELDLDFGEPTEEVDAEGTGEAELSDDELAELDLDLAEVENEEEEEEKKEESLNLSKEAPSDYETEHKSENLTLNEHTENESLNNSEVQKEAEEGSELKTENESENLTLNEEVDKDLDKKLKDHNDYIEYLKNMINQEEEALKKTENEEVKAAIQRRLDAFNADLEAALPDALKSVPEVADADLADNEPLVDEAPIEDAPIEDAPVDEAPVDEAPVEDEVPVEEQLTEEAPAAEGVVDGKEINYVDYKHSYCHALAPKLRAINYLVKVKKVAADILKGYILKLLKDPEVRWTEKEKEFKKNLESKTDVYDILNYVKNSIEKAKALKVKVNDNGELVESLFEGCLYEELNEGLTAYVDISGSLAAKEDELKAKAKEAGATEIITFDEYDFSPVKAGADKEKVLLVTDNDDVKTNAPDLLKNPNVKIIRLTESLNEAIDPEIEAIINSWGTPAKEALEECGEKPIEECNKAPLKEDDEENFGPGREVTNIQVDKDGNVTDVQKRVADEEGHLPPLKEEAEEPVEEPIEDAPKEELPEVDFTTSEVKEVAEEVAEKMIDNIETKGLNIDTEE